MQHLSMHVCQCLFGQVCHCMVSVVALLAVLVFDVCFVLQWVCTPGCLSMVLSGVCVCTCTCVCVRMRVCV